MNYGYMFSYDKLWHLLIAKMGRGESVTLETLAKICLALNCGVGDIVDLIRKNK